MEKSRETFLFVIPEIFYRESRGFYRGVLSPPSNFCFFVLVSRGL